MSRPKHLVRACAIVFVALVVAAVLPQGSFARDSLPSPLASPQLDHVRADSNTIVLDADAPPAPAFYGNYRKSGSYLSAAQYFASRFQTLQLAFTTSALAQSMILVDLRASADGQHWTEWEVDLASGASVTFDRAARFAQYRVTLLGNGMQVALHGLTLTPVGGLVLTKLDEPVAPTFKVHATRMGMVGGRTANGHIITKRDHYVSLPSRRSLSSRKGQEYMVRISYNGRSTVAPVMDVGPWNIHDDYWNTKRERFDDLKRGWPQDHAAYFDGYNKGVAEKGRVSFPTAVDVGDGVWIDDLGIRGDRAVIEVTFLWLGTDPQAQVPPASEPTAAPTIEPTAASTTESTTEPTAAPTTAPTAAPTAEPITAPTTAPTTEPTTAPTTAPTAEPTAAPTAAPTTAPTTAPTAAPTAAPTTAPTAAPTEILVSTGDAGFKRVKAKVWYDGPDGCGTGSRAHWTYTTPDPKQSENTARWQPALATEALYDVAVYIPDCAAKKARTTTAHYLIKHRDGQADVVVDQEANAGKWVALGRYPFATGRKAYVELRDITGDSMQVIWFDAVRWTPVK